MLLSKRHFPQKWKEALAIMLKKAGKPHNETQGYRPISLLSAISKIAERIIETRLKEEIEEKQLLPDHQFGFRTDHSTIHQVTRLTEDIIRKFNVSTSTGAIFIDIEKRWPVIQNY